jgi:hypothetical protein
MALLTEKDEFEFSREWQLFRQSSIRSFLVFALKQELGTLQRKLEAIEPDDLKKAQGEIQQVRRWLTLIETQFVAPETVKSVIAFSQTYGRN